MNCRIPVLGVLLGISVIACKQQTPTDLTKANLIPIPVSVTATAKSFELTNKTGIYLEGESPELQFVGHYLADRLKPSTGFELPVSAAKEHPKRVIFIWPFPVQMRNWERKVMKSRLQKIYSR